LVNAVNDLKGELASLRIERDRPAGNPWRWPVLLLIPAALLIGVLYVLRIRAALQAVEIDTVHASVQQQGAPSAGTPILTASGYVVARRKAVVSAKIQGRLSELAVEEGSHVVRGDVIARLESADYEAQLLRARAAVQHAEADLEEQKRQLLLTEKLAQAEVASQDQLAAAKSRVRLAEAALAQAQADLSFADATLQNTQIRAPFTGVVVKKMAEVGESVAPIPPGVNISTSSGAIIALADLATLEVEADVSESNVAKLGDNQPAEVTAEAFPDRKYKGVLRQIIPTADRTKATVQVKVTILDKDKDLKPEMSAKVTFLEPESKAVQSGPAEPVVTVPKETIVERGGKSVVLEVQEGRVHERPIVISDERQGRVGIRSGLTGSETLVAHPPEALKEGDRVRVKG
jgi:HlyD family secretion protein